MIYLFCKENMVIIMKTTEIKEKTVSSSKIEPNKKDEKKQNKEKMT